MILDGSVRFFSEHGLDGQLRYLARGLGITHSLLYELERRVLLSVMDRKWREHLYEMDYLQEGIGLRAMGQRDPLVEYQREGFDMFGAMMEAIKEESVGFLFNVEVEPAEHPPAQDLIATGPGEQGGELMVEHLSLGEVAAGLAGSPPTAPAAPGGVAGSPVASAAPVAFAEQQSLAVEHPALPSSVESPDADNATAKAVLPPAAPAAAQPPARTALPDSFGRPERPASLQYSAPSIDTGGVQTSTGSVDPLTGQVSGGGEQSRNALCHCGSGKKFKRCHGDPRAR